MEDFTLKHLLRFEICASEICEKFVTNIQKQKNKLPLREGWKPPPPVWYILEGAPHRIGVCFHQIMVQFKYDFNKDERTQISSNE